MPLGPPSARVDGLYIGDERRSFQLERASSPTTSSSSRARLPCASPCSEVSGASLVVLARRCRLAWPTPRRGPRWYRARPARPRAARAATGKSSTATRCLRASARRANSRSSARSSSFGSKAVSASASSILARAALVSVSTRSSASATGVSRLPASDGLALDAAQRRGEPRAVWSPPLQAHRAPRQARRQSSRHASSAGGARPESSSSPACGSRLAKLIQRMAHIVGIGAGGGDLALMARPLGVSLLPRGIGNGDARRLARSSRQRRRPARDGPHGSISARSSCWPWISTRACPTWRNSWTLTLMSLMKARLRPSAPCTRRKISAPPRPRCRSRPAAQARDGSWAARKSP